MLNVLTVTKVSEVISDDTERAGWMGNVSIIYCLLYKLKCGLLLVVHMSNLVLMRSYPPRLLHVKSVLCHDQRA